MAEPTRRELIAAAMERIINRLDEEIDAQKQRDENEANPQN